MNLCIVQSGYRRLSETFIQTHVSRLPANVTAVHGRPPHVGDTPILSDSLPSRVTRYFSLNVTQRAADIYDLAYEQIFRKTKADAVMAEYGPAGVAVMPACERLGIPFVVHFHGYDACRRDVLKEHAADYREMFGRAQAIIAVSREMRKQLISLGAPEKKVFLNPCGVDTHEFPASSPSEAPPTFLTVGRFVSKKAPHLTIVAFANVNRRFPDARLRMIGDGPLLGVCRDIAAVLDVQDSVDFLGPQPSEIVQREMTRARAFLLHSVVAEDGDTEGTPVVILEAGASALPVVSTIHAGIPDVILHDETGLLVKERDTDGMADQMARLLQEPALAARLGVAARKRVSQHFETDKSVGRLWSIIDGCVQGTAMPPLDHLPSRETRAKPSATANPLTFNTKD